MGWKFFKNIPTFSFWNLVAVASSQAQFLVWEFGFSQLFRGSTMSSEWVTDQ